MACLLFFCTFYISGRVKLFMMNKYDNVKIILARKKKGKTTTNKSLQNSKSNDDHSFFREKFKDRDVVSIYL